MAAPALSPGRERLAFVSQVLQGYQVEVQLTTGAVYEGVFHTGCPTDAKSDDYTVVLKMAELKMTAKGFGGEPSKRAPRAAPAQQMVLKLPQLVSIKAVDVGMSDLAVGPSRNLGDGFTDGSISKGERFERELVAWTGGDDAIGGIEDGGGLLEDPTMKRSGGGRGGGRGGRGGGGWGGRGGGGGGGEWDQFAANKNMFGVDTTFDETLYTTAIDKSGGGITEAEAARIAREIESQTTSNIHLQEERGQRTTVDYDEEDRYGAVIGTGAASGGSHSAKGGGGGGGRPGGPTGKGGAILPSRPAWGGGGARIPDGVRAVAEQEARRAPGPGGSLRLHSSRGGADDNGSGGGSTMSSVPAPMPKPNVPAPAAAPKPNAPPVPAHVPAPNPPPAARSSTHSSVLSFIPL